MLKVTVMVSPRRISGMRTFGLIGYPLSHSFSKKYFSERFEKENIEGCVYELFPLEHIDILKTLLQKETTLAGLNVTIPYKVAVLPFLKETDEAAAAIGAVNCIAVEQTADGPVLKGYNTDAYGFEESLKPFLEEHHQKALIFGDGGAAKAIKYVLQKLGISWISVVRTPAPGCILYADLTEEILKTHTVLINTTPVGMYPNVDSCPDIAYEQLTPRHLAYDLVYNPEETKFLALAKAKGAKIKNGLEMLHLQAERSWFIWNQ